MIINFRSETDLSGFYIIYEGSVKNERKGIYGISHLMEHLVFHQLDELLDDFDVDGISNNAYTSDNEIVFYFTGLDECLTKYKDIIIDRLKEFTVTEEMFNIERKIVLEEYSDYFNTQNYNHGLNLYRKLFNTFGAIGLREDLETLTYQDCKDYFELQFTQPHKIINVSKTDYERSDIVFSTKVFDNRIVLGDYNNPIEPYDAKNGKSSVINVHGVLDEDFAICDLICDLLGRGLKSPLYQEIREKRGLVYGVSCYTDRVTNDSGLILITSETSDDNVDEYQRVLQDILDNPEIYITPERFDIIKKNILITIKKRNILLYNNIDSKLAPDNWNIENIINDVTFEDMMVVYNKYFKYSKFYKSIN
jgi:predicted Zn-dependent peptidase